MSAASDVIICGPGGFRLKGKESITPDGFEIRNSDSSFRVGLLYLFAPLY